MPFVSPRQSRANVSLVVERKLVRIDALAGRLLDQVDGLGQDRQVAQAEKVHLQQAGRLDVAHRPLGDDFVLALHAAAAARIRSSGWSAITTAAACVPTLRARPFDLHGQVEQLADFGVGVVGLLQVGALLRAPRRA